MEQATSDDKVTDKAIADFKAKKYGEHAVAEDPFNRDANAAAFVDWPHRHPEATGCRRASEKT